MSEAVEDTHNLKEERVRTYYGARFQEYAEYIYSNESDLLQRRKRVAKVRWQRLTAVTAVTAGIAVRYQHSRHYRGCPCRRCRHSHGTVATTPTGDNRHY